MNRAVLVGVVGLTAACASILPNRVETACGSKGSPGECRDLAEILTRDASGCAHANAPERTEWKCDERERERDEARGRAGLPAPAVAEAAQQRTVRADDQDRKRVEEQAQRQQRCSKELAELEETNRRSAAVEAFRGALDECPDSGIPAGTYRTREGASVTVEIEVTEKGCAAYEGVRAQNVQTTKTMEDKNGTFQRDYSKLQVCTVRGIAEPTPKLHAAHTRYDGACLRKIADVIAEDEPWVVVKGAAPTVTVVVRHDKSKLTLVRVGESVSANAVGHPRLWALARTESDAQARLRVATATPPPGTQGANVDALSRPQPNTGGDRDYCRDLDAAKAGRADAK